MAYFLILELQHENSWDTFGYFELHHMFKKYITQHHQNPLKPAKKKSRKVITVPGDGLSLPGTKELMGVVKTKFGPQIYMEPGVSLNIKMSSYLYMDPHVKNKTVSRPSYL